MKWFTSSLVLSVAVAVAVMHMAHGLPAPGKADAAKIQKNMAKNKGEFPTIIAAGSHTRPTHSIPGPSRLTLRFVSRVPLILILLLKYCGLLNFRFTIISLSQLRNYSIVIVVLYRFKTTTTNAMPCI